ncbi:FAD-binding oxidoreductase [Egibacter rhizosphaerae]|uniref:FAD-binding oxidoreductase n=1 Tax=Egibacter rhizosphaerae TaxID=1670831 RepID=A0A411YJV9_9ACTN|nr:FAD-binding and (Fe-S)-binding domain-containing protein [Egibacter rhizosphaerae]QBI21488.1 FAD-binding oxidoreductase [Egibacter rhizosphaerae]
MTATRPTGTAPSAADPALTSELARALEGEVAFDPRTRDMFATDASMYQVPPLGVAYPRHRDDLVAAVEVANRFEVPVLPRGAGTSHCGQTIGAALILDCSRHMTAIRELDPVEKRARVQPGVIQDELNAAAAPHGLWFGPDTSTSNRATLGGMIGNNSCGSRSARYGMTIDHVRSLDCVLSDATTARLAPRDRQSAAEAAALPGRAGELWAHLVDLVDDPARVAAIADGTPPFWRRAGGYRLDRLVERATRDGVIDPAQLFVGAEGTLALVDEAEVGLVDKPAHTVTAVGHFTSTPAAIAATGDAMAAGAAAVELVDGYILDLARHSPAHGGVTDFLEGTPQALLFVEFYCDDPAEGAAMLTGLERTWAAHGHGYAVVRATDPAQQDRVRRLRKAGLGLLMNAGQPGERSVAFVEDTAVDPEHLADYTQEFARILEQHGLRAGFYGHASVGCLHVRPFMDLRRPGEPEKMRTVAREVQQLVARYGGMNSSEHGDGRARSEFNREVFGDRLYELMVDLKRVCDPEDRFNPGNVVDAGPMDAHLREPALPEAVPLPTHFAFDGEDGLRGAANQCMRIGACRKGPVSGGTMCPSYMATRQEEHSTRGRANALVAALSESDPRTALGDERLHDILDLCIECKACASECPLSVDMATMKSEFLAHYHAQHGVPRRARLFAGVRRLYALGAATAPVSNWITRLPGARRLTERVVGIHRDRPLPRFERHTLPRWFARREPPAGPFPRGPLVFLADSFTSSTEPRIGRAAIELLEAAGWEVRLESEVCCGRPMISKGLLEDATARARDLVDRLEGPARAGVPITGCEPSCVLTLGEEHPSLLRGSDGGGGGGDRNSDRNSDRDGDGHSDRDGDAARAEVVGGQSRLVDELLAEALADGDLTIDPRRSPERILYHGHCHQKALVGTRASEALLSTLSEHLDVLDAGCCGMAGSFGFEAEHYDLSLTIGEQRLFPAVRAAGPEAAIAANGVSCRQQIAHGTGRTALHPVELLHACVRW